MSNTQLRREAPLRVPRPYDTMDAAPAVSSPIVQNADGGIVARGHEGMLAVVRSRMGVPGV